MRRIITVVVVKAIATAAVAAGSASTASLLARRGSRPIERGVVSIKGGRDRDSPMPAATVVRWQGVVPHRSLPQQPAVTLWVRCRRGAADVKWQQGGGKGGGKRGRQDLLYGKTGGKFIVQAAPGSNLRYTATENINSIVASLNQAAHLKPLHTAVEPAGEQLPPDRAVDCHPERSPA